MTLPPGQQIERNLFYGKQNTLKIIILAAHFINFITISQIGKVLGEVWVPDVSSKKYLP